MQRKYWRSHLPFVVIDNGLLENAVSPLNSSGLTLFLSSMAARTAGA